ncbi:hypothetical protein Spica_0810 [Gracilinema caldarium DSM 7334]|uniref:Uncharacterized protein n=1 Tax=Gracilinema caldarium (strain ATCC 51460 / DSM 7334 / H1) TaxID=744872 RepID=F8F0A0_GRAC1|nr:hypothetical protein Spica_0810 [Gracilinema caldarium DSM 7334]
MNRLTIKKYILWVFLIIPLFVVAHPITRTKLINDQIYNAILENRLDDLLLLLKESKDLFKRRNNRWKINIRRRFCV